MELKALLSSVMTSTVARYAIVTGANAPGLGFRTAQMLASPPHRFRVVLACRDEAKGLAAQRAMSSADPEAWVQYVHLDLAHLESVRRFADAFRALDGGAPVKNGLSLLVCNAAVGFGRDNERKVTADGFERAMGTNHLGHFLLVNLLLPYLRRPEAGARVVVVSSSLHDPKSSGGTSKKPTTLGDLDDLMLERPGTYEVGYAYRRSKLANMLFACELHRRLKAARCHSVSVRALEPGFIPQTALGREAGALGLFFMQWVLDGVLKWVGLVNFTRTIEEGATCEVLVSTAPDAAEGGYHRLSRHGPFLELVQPSEEARNEDLARRLWEMSAKLTRCAETSLAIAGGATPSTPRIPDDK